MVRDDTVECLFDYKSMLLLSIIVHAFDQFAKCLAVFMFA